LRFAATLSAFLSRQAFAAAWSLSRRALRISAWQHLHALCVPVLARLSAAYSASDFTSPHRVHAFVPSLTTPNPSVNRTLAGEAWSVIVAFVGAKAGYLKR
jgi:hypothetical protein